MLNELGMLLDAFVEDGTVLPIIGDYLLDSGRVEDVEWMSRFRVTNLNEQLKRLYPDLEEQRKRLYPELNFNTIEFKNCHWIQYKGKEGLISLNSSFFQMNKKYSFHPSLDEGWSYLSSSMFMFNNELGVRKLLVEILKDRLL